MSVLELSGRPYTVFDPSNKDHRRYYNEFVKTASWGKCPVRFVVPEDHGDLVTMIQRSLVNYYVTKEFPIVVKKQRRRIKKKPAKE
jgi:hypothetical protein